MNIVILLCLVIFITYIMICCILAYYFFKHRNIWNQLFDMKNINIYHLLEYFECPKHSIFWIPNIIHTSINCSSCKEELYENELFHQQLEILGIVYSLFKQIDTSVLTSLEQCEWQYKMFLWLLEGSIKDYEMIKNESNDIYYKLKNTYLETNNITNNENINPKYNKQMDIEILPYLENNIQIFDKIITCIEAYYNKIYSNTACSNNILAKDILANYIFTLLMEISNYARITNINHNLHIKL